MRRLLLATCVLLQVGGLACGTTDSPMGDASGDAALRTDVEPDGSEGSDAGMDAALRIDAGVGDAPEPRMDSGPGDGGEPLTDAAPLPPRGALPGEWIPCPSGAFRPEDFGAAVNDGASDSAAISSAVEAASPSGGAICFSSGTYRLTENITTATGLSFIGTGTILQSALSDGVQFEGTAIHSLRFVNLTLEGVTFSLGGSSSIRNASDLFFDRLTMYASGSGTNQLLVTRSRNVHIQRSIFRRDASNIGRGIVLWKNADVVVEQCSLAGHYMTGINISGSADLVDGELSSAERSLRHTVRDVMISRTPGDYDEDHGIYALGFDDLVIEDVQIDGWSSTAFGGALKIRNGDNGWIRRCEFGNSGILLYTYETNYPHHLRNMHIEDITVSVGDPLLYGRRQYPALSYWRNFPSDAAAEDIEVRRFRAVDGEIGISAPVSVRGIRVYDTCALAVDAPPEVELVTPVSPCSDES